MIADCLLEEYENAIATQSHGSQWMKQLLLPHLEKFHQVSNLVNIVESPAVLLTFTKVFFHNLELFF